MVGGIAALRALKEAGFVPAKPLEVVMFTSEEPTRFALSCSGSRAMAGAHRMAARGLGAGGRGLLACQAAVACREFGRC